MAADRLIWKVSADGTIVTQLTNTAYPDEVRPVYSPDGTKILYDKGYGGWFYVWIMNSDGTSQTSMATMVSRLLKNCIRTHKKY